MFNPIYGISKFFNNTNTNIRIRVLYKRLKEKKYSDGRILKALVAYRKAREVEWSFHNLQKVVNKAIKNGKTKVEMSEMGLYSYDYAVLETMMMKVKVSFSDVRINIARLYSEAYEIRIANAKK